MKFLGQNVGCPRYTKSGGWWGSTCISNLYLNNSGGAWKFP